MTESRPDLIRNALLQDVRAIETYHRNVWFRSGIDQLASVLPFIVEGALAQAEEHQAEFDKLAEVRQRTASMPPIIKSGGDTNG